MGALTGRAKTTQTVDYPDWIDQYGETVAPLATQAAQNLSQPFQAYTGQRVADFTADQTDAFGRLRNLIGGAPNIWPTVQDWTTQAATAPAQTVSTERAVDEGGWLGAIADYINPYVAETLAPTLEAIDEGSDRERRRIGSSATMAGAYGDARHGIAEGMNERNRVRERGAAANRAYSDAFTQAMGLRSGDLTRRTSTDIANAQFGEQALARLLAGGTALSSQAQADQSRMLQQIQSLLATGGQQQANAQLGLDRTFEEFMRQYGHDFNVLGALTGAMRAAPTDYKATTTQPDNSGLGILGSVFGALMSPVASGGTTALGSLLALSDERAKEDIAPVGELADGQTVYRFRYRGAPRTHIGLMAQEVEETNPEAVTEIGGVKFVDYGAATAPSLAQIFSDAMAA